MNFRQTKFEIESIHLNFLLGLDHSIDIEIEMDNDFINELNWEIRWDLRDWGIKGFYPQVKNFQARVKWSIYEDQLTEEEIYHLKSRHDAKLQKDCIVGYIDISEYDTQIKAIFENDQFKCEILDIDFEEKTIQIF